MCSVCCGPRVLIYCVKVQFVGGCNEMSSFASEKPSLEEALGECAAKIKGEMGSDTVDLAVVFVSPHYREAMTKFRS